MSEWISPGTALCVFLLISTCVSQGDIRQVCSCASDADGGCVPNQLCDPDGNCNKVNVAYGKQAQISSRYPNSYANDGERAGPACAAVNGRTGYVMKRVGENDTNCVHTLPTDTKAWWRVDLGQNYTVTDLTIYSRELQTQRLGGIWIYVDGNICTKLPADTVNSSLTSTIICDNPLKGQVVTLAKNGTTINDRYIINFCEVQIWVCKAGRFGGSCNKTCHCHNNVTCDNHYGTCHNGCMEGYYGDTCSERCGQCLEAAVCNGSNGRCPDGCAAGYYPPLCNTTCQSGTFGENCREPCGRCQNSAACDVINGSCQACVGTFALPLCKDCRAGYHGDACRERCGQCADSGACDRETGHCVDGCQYGYQPPLCMQHCKDGYHGDGCRQRCGQCADSQVCDKVTGHCPDGCQSGYPPPYCKQEAGGRSEAGSVAGPIAGAVVGGFLLLAIVVLIVGLYRRRACIAKPRHDQAPHSRTATSNSEPQAPVEMTSSTAVGADFTGGERGDYDTLQYEADDKMPYDTPVFAKS